MKTFFRAFFVLFLVFSIVAFLFLPPQGYIPILMYHFVLPQEIQFTESIYIGTQDFERQMWFLRTFGYHPISISDYDEIRQGRKKSRGKEVLVTFDDGHESYLQHAWPILKKYEIPSVNFLIWKHLSEGPKATGGMSLEQAKSLDQEPLVTFASHTITHKVLTEASPEEVKFEIVESKRLLEEAFGKPMDYFCYPTGAFNPEIEKQVALAGYRLAFTTANKQLKGRIPTSHSIARIKVGFKDNLFTFWLKISGLAAFAQSVRDLFVKPSFALVFPVPLRGSAPLAT